MPHSTAFILLLLMMKALRLVWLLAFHVIYVSSLSSRIKAKSCTHLTAFKRREFLVSATLSFTAALPPIAHALDDVDTRATTTLQVTSPNVKIGLELREIVIGTPPRTVVAVKQVAPNSLASRAGIQEGLIVLDYTSARELVETIKNGLFPFKLKFYNLAAGGNAIGDFGKPLVTAQDALNLAKSNSGEMITTSSSKQQEYIIRVLKEPVATCNLKSRRGDVLEIIYEARFGSTQGPIYDSSSQRGTGQPYQFVLGSGDMIPGVDNGLINACPGEIRLLEIPPALGYGPRASKSFGIPSPSSLYWTVEVVSVNSVREGDARDREELEGRAAW
jgi:FK506-binding protein 2